MEDGYSYFADRSERPTDANGTWIEWDQMDPLQILPGLMFQPVVGDQLMVNFVRLNPNTEVPRHHHEEEQISFVMEGELEFDCGGETRTLRRGLAVVIPANMPHGGRTHGRACFVIDVFTPPRKQIVEAIRAARATE